MSKFWACTVYKYVCMLVCLCKQDVPGNNPSLYLTLASFKDKVMLALYFTLSISQKRQAGVHVAIFLDTGTNKIFLEFFYHLFFSSIIISSLLQSLKSFFPLCALTRYEHSLWHSIPKGLWNNLPVCSSNRNVSAGVTMQTAAYDFGNSC